MIKSKSKYKTFPRLDVAIGMNTLALARATEKWQGMLNFRNYKGFCDTVSRLTNVGFIILDPQIPSPAVQLFYTSSSSLLGNINPGTEVTLHWGAIFSDSASIDNGIGNLGITYSTSVSSGTVVVSPSTTTTYTLTATSIVGSVTTSVTIYVIPWAFTDVGFIAGGQEGALRSYTNPSAVASSPWSYAAVAGSVGLKMAFENDFNCLEYNPNTQTGTASATLTNNTGTPQVVTVNWVGLGEQQDFNYEKMSLYINGSLVGTAHAPGGGLGCAPMAPIISNPLPPVQFVFPAGETYDIYVYVTTNDGLYTGPNAYYQFTLSS